MQLRPQGPSFFIFLCCTFYGGGLILRLVSPHGHMVAAKNTQEKNALFPSRHGLEEAQSGIKIAGRNINNLTYEDDTTLMAESEEELKSFLMKVKVESEKVGLKLNIQKMKIMASTS